MTSVMTYWSREESNLCQVAHQLGICEIFASNDSRVILIPESAIEFSYNLLLQMRIKELLKEELSADSYTAADLEAWLSHHNANFAVVEFPNGNEGVFVAIGFPELRQGFQFLYRVRDEGFQLVSLIPMPIAWGTKVSTEDYEEITDYSKLYAEANLESVELFCSEPNQCRELLKITGVTFLLSERFQIIDITDNGIQVVFTGANTSTFPDVGESFESIYRYEYVDLDNDGIKEIVQNGEECHYQHNTVYEGKQWVKKIDCKETPQKVYKFNGMEYVVAQ